jgi:hypothetical protein
MPNSKSKRLTSNGCNNAFCGTICQQQRNGATTGTRNRQTDVALTDDHLGPNAKASLREFLALIAIA